MTRAAQAVIDLAALRHNLNQARAADPKARQFAVIKANAYGHGMLAVARALAQADGFAVASVDEALELRQAGISQPLLVLEGFYRREELDLVRRHRIEVAVHHAAQLDLLEAAAREMTTAAGDVRVWLKVDTGMHRLGFTLDQAEAAWRRLKACPLVQDSPRLMTHLASADDLRDPATQKQLDVFKTVLPAVAAERSIANSAGILGWPASHAAVDRPGILLYGVSPFLRESGAARGLRPVMTLSSELIAVNQYRQGDALGYGGSWQCPQDMSVGVIAIGYGDGYPRHARVGTPVLVNGRRVPLVGRVSMDMICVDLRDQPQVRVGDPVVLWGEGLPAEEIADCAETIAYELFCNVSIRVPRRYVNG